jgi:5-methylcytosine-specific restriction endonuclease McrA
MRTPRVFQGAGRACFKCVVCGSWFERYVCEIRHPDMTCGNSCRTALINRKTKRNRVNLVCEVCSASFQVVAFRGSGARKARFCSDACKNDGLAGSRHPNWRGGVSERRGTVRRAVAQRVAEAGQCERCGSRENLQGHHVRSYSMHPELRDDPSNIAVLCASCHAAEHPLMAGMIARPRFKSGTIVDCPICGEGFYVKMSHIGSRVTCSRACAGIHRSQARSHPVAA